MNQEPNSENKHTILDASIKPINKQISLGQRWATTSKKAKVSIISVVAFIALLSGFLVNVEKIVFYFKPSKVFSEVPKIMVKVSNSSSNPVTISTRGDCILWFPVGI